MELKYYFASSIRLLIILLPVLGMVSCYPSQETASEDVAAEEETPQILKEPALQKVDTVKSDDLLKLKYKNKSTSLTIPLDLQKHQFVLELKGMEMDPPKDSLVAQDSVVQAIMADRIKKVMKYFRRSQDLFYRQDYEGAMEMINKSLKIQQTADALGLKGTIFFMMDNVSSAKYYWNMAVKMDPETPVPDIPQLEGMVEELKISEMNGADQ